jgi:crotonobetainyl-CoA:carnitine CoA-transferase CaiB-like acyl-CoA transferase
MGGQFNNKNSGKRGMSLNIRHPKGLEIARRMVAASDVVAEGFSPGVLKRLGLGYDVMRGLNPSIIYVQQSGMGGIGTYGRFRTIGPVAAAFAGISEMSGLPEPAMPVGWGYSYLDWIGAYGFALAIVGALYHRDRTGEGQWIDSSQCESGIFLGGMPVLDWFANGRSWTRIGNRSPYKVAAPHGAYRCAGEDRWIAIAVHDDMSWRAMASVAGRPGWADDQSGCTGRGDQRLDPWAGGARLHDGAAGCGRRGGRLPDRRGPLRPRPATPRTQLVHRGHGHEDRAMAGDRTAHEDVGHAAIQRRAGGPRRALLRRG